MYNVRRINSDIFMIAHILKDKHSVAGRHKFSEFACLCSIYCKIYRFKARFFNYSSLLGLEIVATNQLRS